MDDQISPVKLEKQSLPILLDHTERQWLEQLASEWRLSLAATVRRLIYEAIKREEREQSAA